MIDDIIQYCIRKCSLKTNYVHSKFILITYYLDRGLESLSVYIGVNVPASICMCMHGGIYIQGIICTYARNVFIELCPSMLHQEQLQKIRFVIGSKQSSISHTVFFQMPHKNLTNKVRDVAVCLMLVLPCIQPLLINGPVCSL